MLCRGLPCDNSMRLGDGGSGFGCSRLTAPAVQRSKLSLGLMFGPLRPGPGLIPEMESELRPCLGSLLCQ